MSQRFERLPHSQKWGEWLGDKENFMMTLADMDLPLYQPFRKAILSRLAAANNFTYKYISNECSEAIINWYQQRHIKSPNISLHRQQIVQTPSLLNILYLLIDKLTNQSDGILQLTPVYSNYERISRFLKRKVVESRLHTEVIGNQLRYDINFNDLEEKAKSCKVMVFCNPHNPSGRVWTQKEVEKVVSICQKNGILIVSDEILSDLTPIKHLSRFYSMVNSSYKNIVVCNSISKAFNSVSLRAGYAIIKDQTIRHQYKEIIYHLNLYSNEFAMICTEIYYSQQGLNWIDYALSIIHKNYSYLMKKIKGTMLVVSELEAGFIITLNFQGYLKFIERWFTRKGEGDRKSMVSCFLKAKGISGTQIIYDSVHGVFADIRITIAIEPDLFVRFADRLRASLLELQFEYRNIDPKL